jgi:hypothetical protein
MPLRFSADSRLHRENENVMNRCGEVRIACSKIAGTTGEGETVVIEQHQQICLADHSRDWRRVRVRYNGEILSISATAWEHATPVIERTRRRWDTLEGRAVQPGGHARETRSIDS